MGRSYAAPVIWMVIYERGVPGEALSLKSTNYPDQGHHGDRPLRVKNSHGTTGNRTRDLMSSSQESWPPVHEAGRIQKYLYHVFLELQFLILMYLATCSQHVNRNACSSSGNEVFNKTVRPRKIKLLDTLQVPNTKFRANPSSSFRVLTSVQTTERYL
jgi:hypothetical protein